MASKWLAWENKWWVWVLLVLFLLNSIFLFAQFSEGGSIFNILTIEVLQIQPLILFLTPLGLAFLIGIKNPNLFATIFFNILFYGTLYLTIKKITSDKRFNYKLILFLLLFIALTMYGCTTGGNPL
jgi:hypothetical protein